jgi:hypothetical protein
MNLDLSSISDYIFRTGKLETQIADSDRHFFPVWLNYNSLTKFFFCSFGFILGWGSSSPKFTPPFSYFLAIVYIFQPFDKYYYRRLHRWTGHVARMPLTRAPRLILTSWVDSRRPLWCPQMNWGRTLKKALQGYDLPTEFAKWREVTADRNQWRAHCSSKMPKATKETPAFPQ